MAVLRRGMEPIEAVLRYPTRREDWVTTLLIGGVLTLFSVLVVPAIVVSGYVLAVIRGRTVGEQAPPGFGDWGTLFVDGLKAWVVGFVYAIIPVAVGLLVFGGAVAAFASGTDAGVALGLLSLGIGSLVWLVVALAFFYPFPASLANLAATGRLGGAFDVGTVRHVVTTRAYAVAWLWGLAVLGGGGVLAGMVNAIPLVGWIVGALLFFYIDVVIGVVWGAGYADALAGTGRGPDAVAEDEPAAI